MSVAWTIAGQSLAELGLTFAGGAFRSGAPSVLRLRQQAAFDAAPLFSYGTPVALVRDGAPYFQGKVASIPRFGRGSSEGQEIQLVDAWQDLEDTIYLEPWAVGSGSYEFPMAVLGRSKLGAQITTGQQIREAVEFAISAGVDLQLGSVPDGIVLTPSEVRNVSCAEVIRISTRLHPDWLPEIDHSTTPPTFAVRQRATMPAIALSLDGESGVTEFDIARRDDLMPEAVRVIYTNATIIDGVTYRDGIVDKFPAGGPDKGPRVLSTVIELAGGQMQFQKARIQTRTIPEDSESPGIKAWVKKKYLHLREVPEDEFEVTAFFKTLIDDPDDHPDPINPRAERLPVDDAADLPRELVRGTIEDWMRKKVGEVYIQLGIQPTEDASLLSKSQIAKGTPGFSVVATNATTKIYKGVTSWVAPESAPSGIAASVYNALAAYQFEGTVSLELEDVTATRYHARRLNLTGGAGEWASMGAMVHGFSFDVDSGTATLNIGPAPYLSAEDFLELQRLLRGRPVTWMSEQERTSNELGAEFEPGSKGDTVSGYDIPSMTMEPGGPPAYSATIVPARIAKDGSTWKVEFTRAKLWEQSLHDSGKEHQIAVGASFLDSDPAPEVALTSGENQIWLAYGIAKEGKIVPSSVQLTIGAKPATTLVEPLRPPDTDGGTTPSGLDGLHVQLIGLIDVPETGDPIWKPECTTAKADIFLPGIEFVGDGQRLYKDYDAANGRDRWRTIKNAAAPSSGASETGENVNFLLEPPSESGEIGDSLVIARLANRATEPQVKVRQVGSGMTAINLVEGNGKDGKRTLLDPDGNVAWEIEWKDGLIVSEGIEDYQDQVGSGSSSGSGGNLPP